MTGRCWSGALDQPSRPVRHGGIPLHGHAALRGTADEWPGHVGDVAGRGVVLDLVRRGGRDEEGHRAKGSSPTGPAVHGAVQRGGRPVVQPTPSAASASVSSPTRASSCTSVDDEASSSWAPSSARAASPALLSISSAILELSLIHI